MNKNSRSTEYTWRLFQDIPAGQESAAVASSCIFSMATLQIASVAGSCGFALTERRAPALWRWAVVGPVGFLVEEGFEETQDAAKGAAEEALELGRLSPNAAATA
jgi:hypothetical protein